MIDEIGNHYGYLTVLKRSNKKTKNRCVCWECLCICGNTTIVSGDNLRKRKGNTKSCGCLNKEKNNPNRNNIKSLVGQKFGFLNVLEQTLERNFGNVKYLCQCECGTKLIVIGNHLQSGSTISCGCIKSKGELEISKLLILNNIKFQKEYSFSNLKNKRLLKFDFAIFNEEDKLIKLIEFQGIQHYKKDNLFYSKENEIRDQMKRDYCIKNNIKLIEIPYTSIKKIAIENFE